VRLRTALLLFFTVATPVLAEDDFAPFWTDFSAAAKAGDQAKVRALTKFPFGYDQKQRGEDDFAVVWKGLFTAKARACLGKGKPVKDQENYVVFCGEVGFYFEKTSAGWRFTEIGAND
jgi:hypothetical protein